MIQTIEKDLRKAESIVTPPIVVLQRRYLTVKDIVFAAYRVRKKYGISAINGTRLLLKEALEIIKPPRRLSGKRG